MKIQGLAIIFILIILPITLIIGEYANAQKQTIALEQKYDSNLINATHDAIKAFQINTFNDAASDIADSKIKSIEASVNAFYNSMESNFGMQGYSKETLQSFIPALVYTMYDGYYIYSPYTNVADISSGTELEIKLDSNKIEYGFKPYVYYSCRYTMGSNSDFVINYSLDNYITIQGIVNNEPVNGTGTYSGYLLTIADSKDDEGVYYDSINDKYYYSGIEIKEESNLTEFLVESDSSTKAYKYIKLNGTKYYLNETEEYIFYILGGNRIKQVTKAANEEVYSEYVNKINNNTSGITYYKDAYEFSKWVQDNLKNLKVSDAQANIQDTGNGNIFTNEKIEYNSSNFNLHRKEVIRYSIESNLSVAIANFNSYTNSGTNFQMPKLDETEWEMLQNEVSMISFLQGLNIGGKLYNGYTVVTNSKTEEVVKEERIYITTTDGYYHRINDEDLISEEHGENDFILGILDLDFETRRDGATGSYYVHRNELGCYGSIVGQENVDNRDDSVYEYLQKLDDTEITDKIKQVYYTALGRERFGKYKIENHSNITTIIANMEGNIDSDIEDIDNYVTADTLTAEDYGKYVTNYTPTNGVNNEGIKWRIFHSDGSNIYLIADNYVKRTYVPKGKSGTAVGTGSYARGFSLAPYKDYAGTANVASDIASKWLKQYTNAGYTAASTNINARATAYLLDTTMWKGFKDSNGYAEYAIGGPTLELFRDSYNVTHDKDIETQVSSTGYQLRWKTENNSNSYVDYITGLTTSESLYIIRSSTNAYGMYIASPSNYRNNYLVCTTNFGYLANAMYSDSAYGVRPCVALKSNVQLEKQADGSYQIVEQTIITASEVTSEDYGGYVTNYVASNASNADLGIGGWRIFHSDGSNIYLIADDYVNRSYVPTGRGDDGLGTNGTAISPSSSYARGFSLAPYADYDGTANIESNIASKLLKQFTDAGYTATSTNISAKATAYLLDTTMWKGFKDINGYAEYAIGGPTLELFRDSYNVTHETDIETEVTATGYQLRWKTEDNSNSYANYISGLTTSESLYVISSSSNAYGMWFASPSAYFPINVMNVNFIGLVQNEYYNATVYGVRPCAVLKSNIQLEKQADGTYLIIK